MPEPRLMPARKLRAYLGVNAATLRSLRKLGLVPGPLPGTRLYDREAVERALDRENGLGGVGSAKRALGGGRG